MLNMAQHKFASNVCEKAFIITMTKEQHTLVDEIITSKPGDVSPIVFMVKDQFASMLLGEAHDCD